MPHGVYFYVIWELYSQIANFNIYDEQARPIRKVK